MYTLLLVTTQTFLGQYQTLEACNKAIREIYIKELMPLPQNYSEKQRQEIYKVVDYNLQYQSKYVCVKQ